MTVLKSYWKWAIGLAILVAAIGLWLFTASVTYDYEDERPVLIPRGSSFADVVDSLAAREILSSPARFGFVARLTGWHRQMKPGYYTIESGSSSLELLDIIRKGLQTPLRVTIPPGSRPGVVAAVLRRDLDIDSTAFRNALRDDSLLAALETDTENIFGFLMPETFEFYWGTGSQQVIRRLKHSYDAFFDAARREKADALNLTVEDVLTIASIVEWEARLPAERPAIAGVYLNRLRIGMPLQADPTVQFALMDMDGGRMRRLLFEDYKVQHPYNTYLYYGLPPGPITNPSPSSVDAVLNAESHDYLYFVADGSGGHVFSRSLSEHNRAAASYRRLMRERRKAQQSE